LNRLIVFLIFIYSYKLCAEEIDIRKVVKKYKGVEKIPKILKGIWTITDFNPSNCSPNCYTKLIINLCNYPTLRRSLSIEYQTEKERNDETFKGFITYPPEKVRDMLIFSITEFDESGNSLGAVPLWYDPKKGIVFFANLGGDREDKPINRIDAKKEKCSE
jgi:hypothetical protein